MKYWYNVQTGEVEQDADPDRSRLQILMGPYDSAEQAQQALAIADQRTQEWDEEERRRRQEEDGWGD